MATSRNRLAFAVLVAFAVVVAIVLLHPPVWATDDPIVLDQARNPGALGWAYWVYPNYLAVVQRGIALIEAPNPLLIGALGSYLTTGIVALFLAWRVRLVAPLALLAPLDYGTLSLIQWILAVYLIGMLVASPPTTTIGRLGDAVGLILAGLTGPASVILLPLFAIRAIAPVWRWHLLVVGCVAAIQLMTMAMSSRYAAPSHDIVPVMIARAGLPIAIILAAGFWRPRQALGALYIATVVAILGIMVTLHTTSELLAGDGARYFYLPWVLAIGLAASVVVDAGLGLRPIQPRPVVV